MAPRGRAFAAGFDAQRQAALIAEIDQVARTLPSVSRRRLLVREAGKLLAVCERYDAMTDDVGLLTGDCKLRVAYEREFLGLQARLDKVLKHLGLASAPSSAKEESDEDIIAAAQADEEER
jgi:hypothetical protein